MAQDIRILIAGAGPTGLVLALQLARRGVAFRIVDAAHGPGEKSRAMAVHARTLEFYDQLGFAREVIAEGVVSERLHLRQRAGGQSREILALDFPRLGAGLSPFPFILTYPQDLHERLLLRQLEALGVTVERDSAITDLVQDPGGIDVSLQTPRGREVVRADYLCGCDGAHSRVREGLGVGFDGGTYSQPFYVADVKLEGAFDADLRMNLGAEIFALVLPVRATGMHRLIGLVPPDLAEREGLTFDDLRAEVEELSGVRVAEVNWFSRYRVHHRVAERFRRGNAFLLGDAGHVHSPVGGQGMNTGIGDAVNLGWKLAQVAKGGPVALLDSYEPERIAFAHRLVATTDRVFTPLVADGIEGRLVRRVVVPMLARAMGQFGATRRAAFRTVSQTAISYPDSDLSEGRAGDVMAGDRLPWLAPPAADNFALLRSLDWQVHVYGQATAAVDAICTGLGVPLHVFDWSAEAGRAGLARDAAYVLRPDGHVGLATSETDGAALSHYLERWCMQR